MKSFRDREGREWTPAVTVGSIKRVRAALEIDLMQPQAGVPPLVARLHVDPVLLIDTIYLLCKPEADARSLTDEEFGRAVGDGETAWQAYEAFAGNLVDFFRQLHRGELAQVMETYRRMAQEEIAKKLATVQRAEEEITKTLEQAEQAAKEEITQKIKEAEQAIQNAGNPGPSRTPTN